jgi:hypothetical protein
VLVLVLVSIVVMYGGCNLWIRIPPAQRGMLLKVQPLKISEEHSWVARGVSEQGNISVELEYRV